METVLQVKGLSKQYKKGIYASHNVTFDVGKGEIFALIGPNGAGKTTTIRMISTLLQATEGDAIVAGHSILTEPDMVRKSITYLPDEAGAYKTMTGREYLEFMASIYADNGEQAYEFVKRGCEICELGDRLNDKISNYSRGMARKLLLARAIMPLPALAILDEPTSGLDIINALEIRRMIRKLASEGMSFLLSSHNMLEIEYVSDRVGIIAKGELLEVGKPAELIEKYGAQNLEEVFERVVLVMAGQAMSGAISDSAEKASDLTICDLDKTEFTESVLNSLKATAEAGDGKITVVDIKSDDYAAELKRLDQDSVVIIPKGFTEQVKQHKKADVGYVQRMTSLATMSNTNTGSDTALAVIQQAVKSTIYQDKLSSGAMTEDEMNQLEDPVELSETTVVGDKADKVSSSVVMSLCSAQSMVVPIIMFVLIMFSAQMILSAISTEKIDKTLETLLSAPVSRLSVLASKMLAAGVVAALQAVVYMFGMSKMTGGLTEGMGDTSAYESAMENLGLTMSIGQYALVGIQMFVSILISLSLSMVLGALAKDAKSAQTMLLPITFSAMISYLLAMVVDIRTLSPVIKYIVYAIPFTHTFMASENVMFGNYSLYAGGLIYQIVLLVVCMTVALKIFMSDKIFTMSIGGKQRTRKSFAFNKK